MHSFAIAFLVGLFVIGPATAAESAAPMYEWIDAYGAVNRSATPPDDTTQFRELRVIESARALTALERRTLEIINEEARASAGVPAPLPSYSPAPYFAGEEQPVVAAATGSASENVRDPCLLSSDPRCHEKHASDYDPRWGYAPSLLRSAHR